MGRLSDNHAAWWFVDRPARDPLAESKIHAPLACWIAHLSLRWMRPCRNETFNAHSNVINQRNGIMELKPVLSKHHVLT